MPNEFFVVRKMYNEGYAEAWRADNQMITTKCRECGANL